MVVRFFGRHIFRWSRDTQEQLSVMSAYVQENLAGVRVVQAYAQEQNQVNGFAAISGAYRHNTMWLDHALGNLLAVDASAGRESGRPSCSGWEAAKYCRAR